MFRLRIARTPLLLGELNVSPSLDGVNRLATSGVSVVFSAAYPAEIQSLLNDKS